MKIWRRKFCLHFDSYRVKVFHLLWNLGYSWLVLLIHRNSSIYFLTDGEDKRALWESEG